MPALFPSDVFKKEEKQIFILPGMNTIKLILCYFLLPGQAAIRLETFKLGS
jgi:hypothetical protein